MCRPLSDHKTRASAERCAGAASLDQYRLMRIGSTAAHCSLYKSSVAGGAWVQCASAVLSFEATRRVMTVFASVTEPVNIPQLAFPDHSHLKPGPLAVLRNSRAGSRPDQQRRRCPLDSRLSFLRHVRL